MGLLHDAAHALADLEGKYKYEEENKSDRWANEEERRVTLGIENSVAHVLGEPYRTSYWDIRKAYHSRGTTSTESIDDGQDYLPDPCYCEN